jgi:hypothetical protein
MDATFGRNPDFLTDMLGGFAPDSVNIGQPDFHPLLGWNVDASNTSQSLVSSA